MPCQRDAPLDATLYYTQVRFRLGLDQVLNLNVEVVSSIGHISTGDGFIQSCINAFGESRTKPPPFLFSFYFFGFVVVHNASTCNMQ